MKKLPPHVRLERLLEILSEEIAHSSDAEILAACADLKIKPEMKGSLAFLGLKSLHFPYRYWVLPEFNDPSALADDESPDISPRQ